MIVSSAAVNCRQLLLEYAKSSDVIEAHKITFDGVDGLDVYNISAEFEDNGQFYIAGRVEQRDNELSHVRIFRKISNFHYVADYPNLTFHNFQDPFVTRIGEHLILGGVQIDTNPLNPNGDIINWRTLFYRGKGIKDLELFAIGPDHMKDIRLGGLGDGRIAIFSRPQGTVGGLGKIGFATVNSLNDVCAEAILNAKIFDTHFTPDEWGGANQIFLLDDGNLGVIGHIAFRDQLKNLHYHAMAFIFDPVCQTSSPIKIIATRSDAPSGTAKRPDLSDIVFCGGMVIQSNGVCELYTGLSDSEACVFKIANPFA